MSHLIFEFEEFFLTSLSLVPDFMKPFLRTEQLHLSDSVTTIVSESVGHHSDFVSYQFSLGKVLFLSSMLRNRSEYPYTVRVNRFNFLT